MHGNLQTWWMVISIERELAYTRAGRLAPLRRAEAPRPSAGAWLRRLSRKRVRAGAPALRTAGTR